MTANAENILQKLTFHTVSLRSLLILSCQDLRLEVWIPAQIPIVKSQAVQIQKISKSVVPKSVTVMKPMAR